MQNPWLFGRDKTSLSSPLGYALTVYKSSKIPLNASSWTFHVICHCSIFVSSYQKVLQVSCLKVVIPTPKVVPKRILVPFPTSYQIYLAKEAHPCWMCFHTHSTRPYPNIQTLATPRTSIFLLSHFPPEGIRLHHITPQLFLPSKAWLNTNNFLTPSLQVG